MFHDLAILLLLAILVMQFANGRKLAHLKRSNHLMTTATDALISAKDALLAEVTEIKGQNASIKAFVVGVPGLVSAAVAAALADAQANQGVTDEQAAAIAADLTEATAELKASADDVTASIQSNPGAGDTAPAAGQEDTEV